MWRTRRREKKKQLDDAKEEMGQRYLPDEIVMKILGYLRIADLGRVGLTCKRLDRLSKDRVLWEVIYSNFFGSSVGSFGIAGTQAGKGQGFHGAE